MKYVYLLISILLIYNVSDAQTEVLGDWYLYSINVNNSISYNQEIGIDYPNLRFNTENGNSQFEGGVCNGYNGTCNINTTTIEIISFAQLLGPCESDNIENFEQSYFYDILNDINSNPNPNTLSYQISGSGLNQSLILTDTSNSNYAIFGRQPQPTDILGDWYLYSTTVDGMDLYNAELGVGQPRIAFTQTNGYQGYFYEGLSCNDFFGDYVFNIDGTITKLDLSTTLNFCDDSNSDAFRNAYELTVLGAANEASFSYEIIGTGDEQTLVLTNTNNSSYATFGRTQQTSEMQGSWFLHYLVIDSNQVNNPSFEVPTIDFTATQNGIGFYFDGFAICTGYLGDYFFNPQQTFNTTNFGTTLGNPCNTTEENEFENYYFNSVLASVSNTELDYEITGTGDDATLVITNISNGNQAFYGRQALSIVDNEFNNSKLKLKQNPVTNTLKISSSEGLSDLKYEIFYISGQRIANGTLNSETIDVSRLATGLYFLKVFNSNNQFETLKFIKE